LKNSLANLYSTNLFEDVEIYLERKNEKNIVVVNLQEKVSRIARFGLRVDNEYLTQVLIDVRDENLFGTGTEIGTTFFSGILLYMSSSQFVHFFNHQNVFGH
jgi:NTE family protein